MYWKLQEFSAGEGWVDVDVGEHPHQFKSARDAFTYYFGKHDYRRDGGSDYRLAPVFSTIPINIERIDQADMRLGAWLLPGHRQTFDEV